MSTLMCSPRSATIALEVLSEDGALIRTRIEGRMAHRFQSASDEPLVGALGFDAYSRQVLIDLSHVSTLDSSGVSWLLSTNKRMSRDGGKLVLHSLPPVVRNLVRVLKLHTVLTIAEDERAAAALLAGGTR